MISDSAQFDKTAVNIGKCYKASFLEQVQFPESKPFAVMSYLLADNGCNQGTVQILLSGTTSELPKTL